MYLLDIGQKHRYLFQRLFNQDNIYDQDFQLRFLEALYAAQNRDAEFFQKRWPKNKGTFAMFVAIVNGKFVNILIDRVTRASKQMEASKREKEFAQVSYAASYQQFCSEMFLTVRAIYLWVVEDIKVLDKIPLTSPYKD